MLSNRFKTGLIIFVILVQGLSVRAQKDSISFLALGDSYTAGTGELRVNSWPYLLAAQLRKNENPVKTPQITAKAGWTTTDLLSAMSSESLLSNYDLVSLQIGVNNQYQGQDIQIFKKEFPELLEKSIVLAQNNPKNVVVLSIPDWSVTPFARFKDKEKVVADLKVYNSIIKEEAEKRGVAFVEITKTSRNAQINSSLIAKDSLHPSKKMYKTWVKKINKKIKLQKQ